MKLWKIMMAAALAVVMSGCAKEDKDICGEWHLSDISVVTKAQEPYEVSVYLAFSKTGGFDLYQKLQDGKYVHYTGNWEMVDGQLYGFYADGTPWGAGSNAVSLSSKTLKLTANNGSGEVTTYKRERIPSSVKENK